MQIAAVQGDVGAASGQAAPRRRHPGGAGPGAAGPGDADAALPHPHADLVGRGDLGEFNIGAHGEAGAVFEMRPEPFYIDRFHVIDEKHRMGIAHADGDGGAQLRIAHVDFQAVHFALQGNVAPVEAGRPHIDGDQAIARPAAFDGAGRAFDDHAVAPALIHQIPGDAARPVAAGLGEAAVGVADVHAGVSALAGGGLDDDDLIATHPGAPIGDGAQAGGVQLDGRGPAVEDHEIVAQSLHLYESYARHEAIYRVRGAAPSNSLSQEAIEEGREVLAQGLAIIAAFLDQHRGCRQGGDSRARRLEAAAGHLEGR